MFFFCKTDCIIEVIHFTFYSLLPLNSISILIPIIQHETTILLLQNININIYDFFFTNKHYNVPHECRITHKCFNSIKKLDKIMKMINRKYRRVLV